MSQFYVSEFYPCVVALTHKLNKLDQAVNEPSQTNLTFRACYDNGLNKLAQAVNEPLTHKLNKLAQAVNELVIQTKPSHNEPLCSCKM